MTKETELPAVKGWQIVPSDPTPEMLGAWYRYKNGHHWPDEPTPRDTSDCGAYRAMLAAAPALKDDPGNGDGEAEWLTRLTRPIIGIENRTPLEVFDIMADRIRAALRKGVR